MNVKLLLCGLFLLLAVFNTVSAKDWRGIVPLHSTLEDVERLLAKDSQRGRNIYDTEEGVVIFNYQSNRNATCEKGNNLYNVPFRTIINIQIESKIKPLLSDLLLDMSKFEQYSTCIGVFGYSNREEGFEFHVYDSRVSTFYYNPTRADAKKFGCPETDE